MGSDDTFGRMNLNSYLPTINAGRSRCWSSFVARLLGSGCGIYPFLVLVYDGFSRITIIATICTG